MRRNIGIDSEFRKYEAWGSISGASLKGTIENSLENSPRCFQVLSPTEQIYHQNYYGGTSTITPGPGAYIGNCNHNHEF